MSILYNLSIYFYGLAISIASLWNAKAKQFYEGRKKQKAILRSHQTGKWIWFHAASLGEYEQGYPVIKAVKEQYPNFGIVVTFFSPSGYLNKKNDKLPDQVLYLPLDKPINARKFFDAFDIKLGCLIKYEFWANYLKEAHKRQIPIICIAARFRKDQWFFNPYIRFFRKILFKISHILVQDTNSLELLESIGYKNVETSGDTRFDRVWNRSNDFSPIVEIESFKGSNKLIVFGSIWPEEFKKLSSIFDQLTNQGYRIIIAPHEIDPKFINRIDDTIKSSTTKWSNYQPAKSNSSILIIDVIGLLSRIYQYADVAYIGGALRGTLHNILEAAVYGIPVFFSQHASLNRFPEAIDLVDRQGAKAINNSDEFLTEVNLSEEKGAENGINGSGNKEYVKENLGATKKTMALIESVLVVK